MKANAIDLDYTDDGLLLERALLNGAASFRPPLTSTRLPVT